MSTLGYSKTPELPITMEATPEEEEVLQQMIAQNVTDTLTERGKRYGKFEDHANVTQQLKRVIFGFNPSLRLENDQREALEMIAHKLGRIVNGDPDYADSWHDIAGYAQLVADRLNGIER